MFEDRRLALVSLTFFAIAVAEGVYRTASGRGYDWRSFLVSLSDRLIYGVLTVAGPITVGVLAMEFLYGHRLFSIRLDYPWAVVLLFLLQEFYYYWFHRASHRIRWFWASHAVHHSPNELNFGASYRLGVTSRIAGSTLFYAPIAWLGFEPAVIMTTLSINLLYQFWLHCDWLPKLGWLELVFNTPSHHRVHHSSRLEHLDANYGGVLIIFDRLFGTFVEEDCKLPCRYGLVQPIKSYNPLYIELHGWLGMVRDLLRSRSLIDVLGYVFGPPGWAPDGQSATTADLRLRAAAAPDLGINALRHPDIAAKTQAPPQPVAWPSADPPPASKD